MPYDPRPVSQGGNRGIDEQFSQHAPEGKFRVIGVDTLDGSDWVSGDFDTLEQAKKHANREGGTMLMVYVYDDQGRQLHKAGRP